MSRTKCGLSGPVPTTPGTSAYQSAGASSIIMPFTIIATPVRHRIAARISFLSALGRGSGDGCDMAAAFFRDEGTVTMHKASRVNSPQVVVPAKADPGQATCSVALDSAFSRE